VTLEKFQTLNPLVLCGVLPPQAGSPVCTGDTISFCNNVYVASQTDTCNKITDTVGTILNIDGGDSYAQTAAAHVLCALQQHACTVLAVLAPPRTCNQGLPLVRTGSNDTTCSDLANSAGVPVCVDPTASPVSCACASAVCLN